MKLKKDIVVYKGCKDRNGSPVLVVLKVPAGSDVNRSPSGVDKIRASRAKVLSIESPDGLRRLDRAYSTHDDTFEYRVGTTARPRNGFDYGREACAGGIHFYLRRREALKWVKVQEEDDPQITALSSETSARAAAQLHAEQLQSVVDKLTAKLAAVRKALRR